MSNFSTYFIGEKNNLVAKKECTVQGKKYRFTVLTDRVIRLEYSDNGIFEDRATGKVIFRNFDRPIFALSESETLVQIDTKYFTLNYVKEKYFGSGKLTPGNTLKVILKESNKEWYFGHPEVRNFGGSGYSLDDLDQILKLDKGLYSTDGFGILDDSDSLVLNDKEEFIPRENKALDIYLFMYKKDFGYCLQDYYMLTGYPSFIPKYALGNWWYKNERYSSNDIEQLINKFEDNNIPLSVLLLGNNWHDGINTYELDQSLKIDEVTSFLDKKDIKLGLTIDPSIPIFNDNNKYNEITKYFKTNNKKFSFIPMDSNKLGVYFNSFIRNLEKKVDFFNIDYNDKKDKNNLWLFDHYHYVDIDLYKNKRPLILSRNAGMAAHRYPILYSGKTKVSWDTLNKLPIYNSSASNMGISWWSHALGGYYGGIEDSELYMRYIQFGVFSPVFILPSEKGKYYKREPWRWNELRLGVIREYMQLRHKLIPYIYTEGYFYHKTGLPVIQPLYYSYPAIYDEPLYKNQYLFGKEMMIAPITKKKNFVMNRVIQRVFVPNGVWYDLKSGKKFPGDKYYVSFYKDEDYPVFCKAGSIIPMEEGNNYEIMIFPGANNSYLLYEDDGFSNNYKNGNYALTKIDYTYDINSYVVTIKKQEGNFPGKERNYRFRFRNTIVPHSITAKVNNKIYPLKYELDKSDFILEIERVPAYSDITISLEGKNLEIEAFVKIYEDIAGIIDDLEINTLLKEKIDSVLFSNMSIKKKRIEIRKLKRMRLESRFIKMFINLLEYISEV